MYVESTWHVFCISFLQMMPLTMLGNIVNAAALKKKQKKKKHFYSPVSSTSQKINVGWKAYLYM